MKGYKLKYEVRKLFIDHDWSIAELENKYGRKMSEYYIPRYMIEKKAADRYALEERQRKQIERAEQRKKHNREYFKRNQAELQKKRKLKDAEKKKFKEMSEKVRQFDINSVLINIKQCPANRFLMGKEV